LGWPTSGEAIIHSLAKAQLDGRKIASVSLLGSTSAIAFDVQNDGLHLRLPAAQASGKYAHCFKITFEPAHQ
jgi:hypothetical protein